MELQYAKRLEESDSLRGRENERSVTKGQVKRMEELENVKRRVKKLLALSKSPNELEVQKVYKGF